MTEVMLHVSMISTSGHGVEPGVSIAPARPERTAPPPIMIAPPNPDAVPARWGAPKASPPSHWAAPSRFRNPRRRRSRRKPRQSRALPPAERHHHQAACRRECPEEHHPVDADANRIAPRAEVAQCVADSGHAEVNAQPGRAQAIDLGPDEGRATQIGEEHARGQTRGQDISPEPRRREKRRIVPKLIPEACVPTDRRLTKVDPGQRHHQQACHHQQGEVRLPAKRLVQHPADEGTQHRHDRHAHRQISDHGGRRASSTMSRAIARLSTMPVAITDCAVRQSRKTSALVRKERAEAGDREESHRGQQEPTPTIAVRQRPDDDLQNGTRSQIERDRKLHHRVIDAESRPPCWAATAGRCSSTAPTALRSGSMSKDAVGFCGQGTA
jgi:hypothetical protein